MAELERLRLEIEELRQLAYELLRLRMLRR